ncbi:ABC transporter permease [Homoserinibacter sp. GY 40078]|uniref:ABC transporter permease n=1 Tax=Homoserinibacter sp. GY 40078 TaxID=2603275 RepID=UPI0011C95FE1|nr:ABC transporter permease [Homoserinibacter sp. GY 40078]TXK18863.1 ABC transporter permease [Homoserinibacter sp. GY 40078]
MTTTTAVRDDLAVPTRKTGFRTLLGKLARDPWAVASSTTIVVFVLAAVFADQLTGITGNDPYTYHQDLLDAKGQPTGWGGGIGADHWFGVEPLTGRDLFAIVVYGARTSLFIGISATVLSVLIGTIVGITSGYFGGWYDRIVSRGVDVMFGFPTLVFLIALMAIIPADVPRPPFIALVIGLFGWPGISRIVRGQALALRERNFVVASKAMGARSWRIVLGQVLPNVGATIIVVTSIIIPGMIAAEAALSFLGVGVTPPTPSWGRTIGDAVLWVRTSPMYLVFPGAALFLITLAFNLFGDSLRDALDPRTARR